MIGKRLVIVGYGMASQRLLEVLSEQCSGNQSIEEITVIGNEAVSAYDRVNLATALDIEKIPSLTFNLPKFSEGMKVSYQLDNSAVTLSLLDKAVVLENGQRMEYDALVLATGADAARPPIPHVYSQGCYVFRDINDAQQIAEKLTDSQKGIIVGGGLLGIELARHLHERGQKVHIVECGPTLMPLQMDEQGAEVITGKLRAMGVEVLTNTMVQEVLQSNGKASGVRIGNGMVIEADYVIFATGIRPRDLLARDAGMAVAKKGGIIVDSYCRTTTENIFAIGDCAVMNNQIYGLVASAYLMASSVAVTLVSGVPTPVELPAICAKLKFTGCDAVSFGDSRGVTPGAKTSVLQIPGQNIYRKLVTQGDGSKLIGGILVGDISKYSEHLHYVNSGVDVKEQLTELLMPKTSLKTESEIPPDTIVCSCVNVKMGDITNAIREKNCSTVDDIKLYTKAGTGCGGCLPAIAEILEKELKKAGLQRKRVICKHFPYSRKELFDLILENDIKTYGDAMRLYGNGEGCEICKPAVASILASAWGDYILDGEMASLQDTNDAYLANIQKDGTYSVVPRIPGGELAAEALEAIGRIGKKYNLYTKITGGQRIALFGVKVDDLPLVWKDFIDAGFELGHAYGKALRTIKSCVGCQWCRFGVQDSTQLAIDLELRYRGLRSPHKIKSAVSGCSRECAEAQIKDFGVVATNRGWNLYVGGNGAKPTAGQLLASDLDKEMVFRYTDRFLMYYIRTADRLERTASWLKKLDGGIEYLRRVVIDDELGVCAELEEEMEMLRSNYRCEWTETLNSPERLKRFRTFINAGKDQTEIYAVPGEWMDICALEDISVNTGVCALVGKDHVAIFRMHSYTENNDKLYAIGNHDPYNQMSVLSRGIIGDRSGEPYVASPLNKRKISLVSGYGVDDPKVNVPVYKVRVNAGRVEILNSD